MQKERAFTCGLVHAHVYVRFISSVTAWLTTICLYWVGQMLEDANFYDLIGTASLETAAQ